MEEEKANIEQLVKLLTAYSLRTSKKVRRTIEEIVDLCYEYSYLGYNFTFDANKLLKDNVMKNLLELSDKLAYDIEETLNEALKIHNAEDDKDDIFAYISRDIDGKTLIQRIDYHVGRIIPITESVLAVDYVYNKSKFAITQDIMNAINGNYTSIQGEFRNPRFKASFLLAGGITYGKGISRNIIDSINLTGKQAITEGYQRGVLADFRRKGAQFYVVHRGSGYDCGYCDSWCGFLIPIDNWVLPLHTRCMCYATIVEGV